MYYAYNYVKNNDGIDTPYRYVARVTKHEFVPSKASLHERLIVKYVCRHGVA